MLCDAAHCDNEDDLVAADSALLTGSDPSAEGVQRDLLPLIEGSVISTKHGPVATDHMLFIASGAFTSAKPSDMMAELQVGMGLNFGLGCLHPYAVSCCCRCSSESESMFACLHCVLCMLPSGFQALSSRYRVRCRNQDHKWYHCVHVQGRLPIRVELKGLTAADFEKILTEPECNMIFQQRVGCIAQHALLLPHLWFCRKQHRCFHSLQLCC